MATLDTSKIILPNSVTTEVASKLHDTSVVAALSPADTLTGFTDDAYNYFTGGAVAEVVAEGAQKSSHDTAITPVQGKRFKVQCTTRLSSELSWADEEDQLKIIDAIQMDQAGAIGEALDYVILHAINPATGTKLTGYTAVSSGANTVNATNDALADFDSLIDGAMNADITGVALSRTWASTLRKLRTSTGARQFPEIPASFDTGVLEGIPASTSKTVSAPLAKTDTKVLAFLGDFSTIKWRIARPLEVSVIPFGDPDGAGDLQRFNQVAYRSEAVFSYAVLDARRLAVLKSATA